MTGLGRVYLLVAVLSAQSPASSAASSPVVAATPGTVSAHEVAEQVQALWKHRDDPAAVARSQKLLDEALARSPNDYELLWRYAALYFWKSDDPKLPNTEKSVLGKKGWDYAERAVAANPKGVQGYFFAAATMGNYALNIGVMKALSMNIEGKFRQRLSQAEALDPRFAHGGIPNAWGRLYYMLPWPKRDNKKADEFFHKALQINPDNLRTRVFLADLQLRQNNRAEAKRLLDEVLSATPGKYDPPEEKRAKILAAESLRKVVDGEK